MVYIHPRANASTATEHIKNTLDRLELISPDAPKFIMGDFNHCPTDKSFKGFFQYVNCTTRLDKILDKCYGSVPDAYRAVSLPPLGSADHCSILLAPAYTPVVKRTDKVIRDIKQWTPDSLDRLQGCFETTNSNILTSSSTNISEQADTVSAYITFCVDNCIPSKKVTIFPEKKDVKRKFKWAIKIATLNYKIEVEKTFEKGNGLGRLSSGGRAVVLYPQLLLAEC